MTVLIAVVLLGVAAAGTATVLTRDPLDQAVVTSFFGLLLGVAFLVLQAPAREPTGDQPEEGA